MLPVCVYAYILKTRALFCIIIESFNAQKPERKRARADWGLSVAHVGTIYSRSAESHICFIIYIWFIIQRLALPNTNLEKGKSLSCYFWLFLNHPIEMAAESSEAIQVPPRLSSDGLCTRERGKKIVLSFYFYFALILFDDVSTGWYMLSWMAISPRHMCLSQDSRVRWILAGRELNTSTKKRKKNYLLNSLLPACISPSQRLPVQCFRFGLLRTIVWHTGPHLSCVPHHLP